MSRVVGVIVDGEETWHVPGVFGDYDTFCGIDANDDSVGHGGTVPAPRGQKITCQDCATAWQRLAELKLHRDHFDPSVLDT